MESLSKTFERFSCILIIKPEKTNVYPTYDILYLFQNIGLSDTELMQMKQNMSKLGATERTDKRSSFHRLHALITMPLDDMRRKSEFPFNTNGCIEGKPFCCLHAFKVRARIFFHIEVRGHD